MYVYVCAYVFMCVYMSKINVPDSKFRDQIAKLFTE
jgi:hypothetical protein